MTTRLVVGPHAGLLPEAERCVAVTWGVVLVIDAADEDWPPRLAMTARLHGGCFARGNIGRRHLGMTLGDPLISCRIGALLRSRCGPTGL